jgi:transcriptional regulator with XRE-family HTH domain
MAPHAPVPDDATRHAEAGLLTVAQAAQHVGVSRATISGWIAGGHLPADIIAHRRYVRPAELATAQVICHIGGVVPAWRHHRRRAGRRLRRLREGVGWTQLELAAASGLSHEAISLLELGRRAPQAESVRTLARALRVAPSQFVAMEELAAVGITAAAAAERLGVPTKRVQTWLAAGQLVGVKVSGQWQVPVAAVAALAASGRLRGRSRRLDPRYRG